MWGDEARVVEAFCRFLEAEGWRVTREVEYVDVLAEKEGASIYAEAKGRTAAVGLDVDTMYGQLLRRMGDQPRPGARYAVVIPDGALTAAKRVPTWVRSQLGIDIYAVDVDGRVELHGSTALTDCGAMALMKPYSADVLERVVAERLQLARDSGRQASD